MKYVRCEVMIGFSDEEVETWSEGADISFGLARKLGHDYNGVYLIGHDRDYIHDQYEAESLKTAVITAEGGV